MTKPKITKIEESAKGRIFTLEAVHLEFSNGQQRIYERMRGKGRGSVMIVAMQDDETVLLVKEYAVGTERYEITLPKGLMEPGEEIVEAANRELQEEIGFAAKEYKLLKPLTAMSGFLKGSSQLVLAKQLYPAKLQGDEPEALEIIPWKLSEINQLVQKEECSDGRTIAALYMVKELFQQ